MVRFATELKIFQCNKIVSSGLIVTKKNIFLNRLISITKKSPTIELRNVDQTNEKRVEPHKKGNIGTNEKEHWKKTFTLFIMIRSEIEKRLICQHSAVVNRFLDSMSIKLDASRSNKIAVLKSETRTKTCDGPTNEWTKLFPRSATGYWLAHRQLHTKKRWQIHLDSCTI